MVRTAVRSCLVIILGAACSGDRAAQTGAVVSDSAGVTIVDNGILDPSLDLLAAENPILQIGVIEGQEEYQLFRVSDIKRLSDGGIVVANAGSRELRLYNADGRHRATVGGAGRGPSEFRYPSAIRALPGDTIEVQDFMDRVLFTADGEYLRREVTDRAAFSALWAQTGGSSEGAQWTADGTLFAPVYHWNQTPRTPGPLYRPNMILVRVSADFSTVDTLGTYGGILQQYIAAGSDDQVFSVVPPFASYTLWAIGSSDGAVVIGDNANPQFERFGADGSHTIVRWSAPAQTITNEEVEQWKDRQRNAQWTRGQLPMLERAWAGMDIPDTKHYYGQVGTGSDGTMWVGPGDERQDTTTLRAFGVDGGYLGTLKVPGWFTPYDSGPGWILGLLRDENEVEFVQLFQLVTR